MNSAVDEEKVAQIYQEAIRIVRKGTGANQTQSEILNALEKMVREVVDDEN